MRSLLAPVVAISAALVLAGCTPQQEPSATQTPTPSTSASASATASPSPSPSAVDEPRRAVPTCEQLVSLDAMYEYNSNVALSADYAPPAGGIIDRVGDMGVACGWVNLTSGEVIALAVGAPRADELAALRSELSSGSAARWNGVTGFFTVGGGVGQASAIVDDYVLVSTSPVYALDSDAAPIVDAALSAL